MPDNTTPTPNRDDYWPLAPVWPSDNSFMKLQLPPKPQFLPKAKPQLSPKSIIDNFAQPLTKIIDEEKIQYK